MKNDILTIKEEIISRKKMGKFDVVILGPSDNLFIRVFSLIINDPNIIHKYLNSYDLFLREHIILPKKFKNIYYPEIIDKLMNIDILILTYENSDLISLENLKTFYHLYYKQLDEKDRPIIIERNNNKNNNNEFLNKENEIKNKIDINDGKKLAELFGGLFCDCNINEDLFEEILIKCINNLRLVYNTESYNLFDLELKEKSKQFNFHMSIYGNKALQNLFLNYLLKLKCNENFQKKKENYYIIKYKNEFNDGEIIIELMNEKEYSYYSQCYIFLYDSYRKETYNYILKLIRTHILNYGAKYKKIYKLFSFNEYNNINEGKNLAKEIGADYEIIKEENEENINELLNNFLNKTIKQVIDFIKINKNKDKNKNDDSINKSMIKSKTKDITNTFFVLSLNDSPSIFIDDFNTKINNEIQNYNQEKFIFNQCPDCYNCMNISIDDNSNIIILKCNFCKKEPFGFNFTDFEINKKVINKKFYCDKCFKCMDYDYSYKKLVCQNCQYNYKALKNVSIPIYLKDYYCELHNQFYKYYLKYSKKGLCKNCLNEKYKRGYFLEKFDEEKINSLIKDKSIELEKEKNFLNSIRQKFKKCIKDLQVKFDELLNVKNSIYEIKKNMIKNLELIKNNYTLISNVQNLKFNFMKDFYFDENDSIENKIKTIFKFFNNEEDISNLYFDKNKENNSNLTISGPYNHLISEMKAEKKNKRDKNYKVTDILGINENKICISFNDGKAKVYDSNIKNNNYPLCIINEYSPSLGVNSLYVSKNQDNKDIIYLCGFESIKLIMMKDNYKSYDKLYEIKETNVNILQVIEIIFDKCLLCLNEFNEITLFTFENNNCNIYNKKSTNITNIFIKEKNYNKPILFMNKLSGDIISLFLSNSIQKMNLIKKKNLCVSSLDNLTLISNPLTFNIVSL